MATKKKELRPFHETVVGSINYASTYDLINLASLLKRTKIPKGHDEIITAWKKRLEVFGHGDYYGVIESLLEQKQIAESESASENKKERALMIVIQKIIARYQEHNAGDLDDGIFKLFETAKKINFAETDAEFQLAIADM